MRQGEQAVMREGILRRLNAITVRDSVRYSDAQLDVALNSVTGGFERDKKKKTAVPKLICFIFFF